VDTKTPEKLNRKEKTRLFVEKEKAKRLHCVRVFKKLQGTDYGKEKKQV